MPFARSARPEVLPSLTHVRQTPFWLDDASRPEARPALTGHHSADLLVIGGGFSGLWAALRALERSPGRRVMLLDAGRVAGQASGRNGGFMAASLTHGLLNGHERWPDDLATVHRLGTDNLDAIEKTIRDRDIPCDFVRDGELTVATEDYQLEGLRAYAEIAAQLGDSARVLSGTEVRERVQSPTYVGAVDVPTSTAVVNPARLAWGLLAAVEDAGGAVHEQTPVVGFERMPGGRGVTVRTPYARIDAARVILATGAAPSPLRRIRAYVVPVHDYVLVTEPLTADQHASIGWSDFAGIGDAGNQFHYYRRTADGRILWGGYDAIYHWRNGWGPQFDADHASFARLADHFFTTFPQLDGLHFTHGWGGAIDTCSRFSAFWGTAYDGALAYVAGYTGLGVGASRFGADTALDLVDGLVTERTELEMVRTRPLPFPPEPLRSVGINLTRRALDKADRSGGRRGPWLRTLDRLGLGFDS
jgi:glycine/D-amino acid oxidase-like deaminating enzyme